MQHVKDGSNSRYSCGAHKEDPLWWCAIKRIVVLKLETYFCESVALVSLGNSESEHTKDLMGRLQSQNLTSGNYSTGTVNWHCL